MDPAGASRYGVGILTGRGETVTAVVDLSPAAGVRADGGADDRRRRRSLDPLRLACHAAVELPFVVVCLLEISAGWAPTSDDAVFTWRAWNVLSAHPTLLGSPTHGLAGGHIVFAPGPLASWLLTVPVHLDPLHGSLWGSALIGAVGAGLAVEAARAAAGRVGMVLCAAALLTLAATQVGVVLDPLWTPWIGAVWFLTTLAAAWATGCGRLGWWVTAVAAASFAAQAHLVYTLAAAGLCAVSLPLGMMRRPSPPRPAAGDRRGGGGLRWLAVGSVCAAVLWLPTVVQQLADRPGNLTLIGRSSKSGGHLGMSLALWSLANVTRPSPTWMSRSSDQGGELATFHLLVRSAFGGSAWWGIATLGILAGIGILATRRRRHALAGAAWIALTGCLLTVATVARVPSPDALELLYLDIVFVPVGMMAWVVMLFGLGEVVAALSSIVRRRVGRDRSARRRIPGGATGHWAVVGALVLLAASAAVVVSVAGLVPSDRSELGGPAAVSASATASAKVAHAVPAPVPFELEVRGGPSPSYAIGVLWGAAYALFASGRPIRLNGLQPYVGPRYPDPVTVAVSVVLGADGRVAAVDVHRLPVTAPGAAGSGRVELSRTPH